MRGRALYNRRVERVALAGLNLMHCQLTAACATSKNGSIKQEEVTVVLRGGLRICAQHGNKAIGYVACFIPSNATQDRIGGLEVEYN